VFLTNNSGPLVEDHVEALAKVGVECEPADLTTSAQAAASMLSAGCRVAVVGDKGILEALGEQGVKVVGTDESPEAVVVGRCLELDYWALSAAAGAVRDGARFIATNTDPTFPTVDGLVPGAGALVSFIATASGRQPEVAGKPHEPMAALVKSRYGALSVVAGDRPDTDGLFAKRTGSRFALVFSGVTQPSDLPVQPTPDLLGQDLAELVRQYLGR